MNRPVIERVLAGHRALRATLSNARSARAEATVALELRRFGGGAHPGPPRTEGAHEDDVTRYEAAGEYMTAASALFFLLQVRDVARDALISLDVVPRNA